MPTDPVDQKVEALSQRLDDVTEDIAQAKRDIARDATVDLDEELFGPEGDGPGPDDEITPIVPPG